MTVWSKTDEERIRWLREHWADLSSAEREEQRDLRRREQAEAHRRRVRLYRRT